MNTSLKIVSVLALILSGCAADAGQDDAAAGTTSEEAISVQSAPGAVAVSIVRTALGATQPSFSVTLGAPSKVAKALRGLRKYRGPVPRCMPSQLTRVRFMDEQAAEVGAVTLACGGIGSFTTKSGQSIQVKASDSFYDNMNAALLPGDALWGIEQIDVSAPLGGKSVSVTDADEIEAMLAAIDPDQAIAPAGPNPRCPPSHIVKFLRKDKEVAKTTFLCGTDPSVKKISARLTIADTDVDGSISLDPRPFVAALAP